MDFYFDENVPIRLARAIAELEKVYKVFSTFDKIGGGVKDISLIPQIKQLDGILVTFDLKIITRVNEFDLIKSEGITVFVLKIRTGATYWEQVNFIMKNWETIINICNSKPHPFICVLKEKGQPEFK